MHDKGQAEDEGRRRQTFCMQAYYLHLNLPDELDQPLAVTRLHQRADNIVLFSMKVFNVTVSAAWIDGSTSLLFFCHDMDWSENSGSL